MSLNIGEINEILIRFENLQSEFESFNDVINRLKIIQSRYLNEVITPIDKYYLLKDNLDKGRILNVAIKVIGKTRREEYLLMMDNYVFLTKEKTIVDGIYGFQGKQYHGEDIYQNYIERSKEITKEKYLKIKALCKY